MVDVAWIEGRLGAALRCIETDGGLPARVTVRIVDDTEMTALHERHCGRRSSTDVLTFPDAEPADEVDIAVCIDEARRAVTRRAAGAVPADDLARELLLYALHGVLHCAGYDDHEPDEFARMHAEEDRVLTAIGVGPVFEPVRSTDGRGLDR